ncbi:MAG: ABC transporter substrate-binding protein [Pseudomonadota bacterium]
MMRRLSLSLAVLMGVGFWATALAPPIANAQEVERVALLIPTSGRYEPIGLMILAQAEALGARDIMTTLDTACDADTAASAARQAVSRGATHIIGLPCIDAFDAALPILAEANVKMTVIGLQAADVATRENVRRVAPTLEQMTTLLADYLGQQWREVPFAVIDDGTLAGRQWAEQVTAKLSLQQMTPVYRDTFRPLLENQVGLVRRLERSGATHVLIGGDARDAAVIAADADRVGVPIDIAGGQTLVGSAEDGALPEGAVIVAPLPFETLAKRALASVLQPNDEEALAFDENGEPIKTLASVFVVRNGVLEALPLPGGTDG